MNNDGLPIHQQWQHLIRRRGCKQASPHRPFLSQPTHIQSLQPSQGHYHHSDMYWGWGMENTDVVHWNKVCVVSGIFLHTDINNLDILLLSNTKGIKSIPLPNFCTGKGRL